MTNEITSNKYDSSKSKIFVIIQYLRLKDKYLFCGIMELAAGLSAIFDYNAETSTVPAIPSILGMIGFSVLAALMMFKNSKVRDSRLFSYILKLNIIFSFALILLYLAIFLFGISRPGIFFGVFTAVYGAEGIITSVWMHFRCIALKSSIIS